jgi:hypothetical protein
MKTEAEPTKENSSPTASKIWAALNTFSPASSLELGPAPRTLSPTWRTERSETACPASECLIQNRSGGSIAPTDQQEHMCLRNHPWTDFFTMAIYSPKHATLVTRVFKLYKGTGRLQRESKWLNGSLIGSTSKPCCGWQRTLTFCKFSLRCGLEVRK